MPEKVIHEIRLNQYIALPADRTRRFSLGTRDSYGVEQLRIVPGEGWDGLMITATFHPPEGEAVQVIVPADGLIDVPPEATCSGSELPTKYGKIVFAGVADGVQRISCNLPYTVMEHAPVDGAASSGPSPSWYEQAAAHFLPDGGKAGQVLAKVSDTDLDVEWADGGGSGTSDHAKLSNRDAADQHPISAITGLQKELDGKQPAGNYLTADTLQAATDAALAQAKESGDFDGADGAPGKDGADGQPGENGTDGYSPTANVTQTDSGATITITDKNGTTTATVTNGKDGADGIPGKDGAHGADGKDGITPTIGENGNWYLGDTDTGTPSRGETGPAGADGKSAYQYAVEGGFTGTEAEFAEKLAQELPGALPNPNALTFMGAATGTYDGSAPLTVNIPAGGSGTGGGSSEWELLTDITLTEASTIAEVKYDTKYKTMYAYFEIPKVEEKISTGSSICLLHRFTLYYTSIGDPVYPYCVEAICNATNQTPLEFVCARMRNGVAVYSPWQQRNSYISSDSCLPFKIKSSIELPAGTVLRVYGRE